MRVHARSSSRLATPASLTLPAIGKRRRPRRPVEFASGAAAHEAPAGDDLELLPRILMKNPG